VVGLVATVYDQIRSDIMSGHFEPGSALGEIALATRYGTSRTPVREALQRLEQEQLVERAARGMQVRVSSPEEILDIYEVRIVLEATTARAAALHRSGLDMMRIISAQEAMKHLAVEADGRARAEANRVFHEAIWSASHSPTLLDLLQRLNTHLIRYPSTTLTHGDRWETVLAEHDKLVGAIEAQDGDAAAQIAEHHMAGARDVRLRMYSAQG
jgi:DNA-binding GntR family transcriptional regulator